MPEIRDINIPPPPADLPEVIRRMPCWTCSNRFGIREGKDGKLELFEGYKATEWECGYYDGRKEGPFAVGNKPTDVFEGGECECYRSKDEVLKQYRRHIPNYAGGDYWND